MEGVTRRCEGRRLSKSRDRDEGREAICMLANYNEEKEKVQHQRQTATTFEMA